MAERLEPQGEDAMRAVILRLGKVVKALMNRAEQAMNEQTSSFGMIQNTLALEQQVRRRTRILTDLTTLEPDPTTPDPQRPQADSAYGRLHGLEGQASALYFQNFRYLLNQPELFSGRTRRPPLDPDNALLSYGYTILLNQVMSALCTVGLDPYIGYLHGTRLGKPALALDLMEEFRPLIVDSVVLTLFNNNILQAKDFITELGGACRLTDSARRTFLTKLEARFDETITHPTFNYKATYRRCLEDVSLGLSIAWRGRRSIWSGVAWWSRRSEAASSSRPGAVRSSMRSLHEST